MTKLVLDSVTSGFRSAQQITSNNQKIVDAVENTLSRDGTGPNQMNAPLDMNGNLILNQANPITVEGFNWEGPWVSGTLYQIGDAVQFNNSSYICIVEHTSGVFATDLSSGKWQVLASSAALPSQAGHTGDVLSTDGSTASWVDVDSVALPISGGTLTGPLVGTTSSFSGVVQTSGLRFPGSGANSQSTNIVPATANRTITIPDADVDLTNVRDATTVLKGFSRFATNTEALAGVLTNVGVTPAGLASFRAYGVQGYQRLPAGLLLQWGRGAIAGDVSGATTINVTYPIAFPQAVYVVIPVCDAVTNVTNDLSAMWYSGSTDLTFAQFFVREITNNVQSNWRVDFIAIGL